MSDILNSAGVDMGIILIVLLVLEIALVIAIFSMSAKVRRLNAKYTSFMRGQGGVSLEKELTQKMSRIEKYAKNIGSLDETLAKIDSRISNSTHKYGIVKYDAFDDVGGKLSFVLNAVHSRDNCFLYIKEIVKGESYIMLSNEEVEALRIARRYGSDELSPDEIS